MSHNAHKIRLIKYNCRRNPEIMQSILEYAKDKADMVLIQEPSTFKDPNDDTRLIITSHPSFHQVTPKHKPKHHARVVTYINNNNPYLTYQPRTDLIDNPDIQSIEISTPSITHTHIFNLYNQKVEGAEDTTRPGEQALLGIELPQQTILTGDMNSHHPWWNSKNKKPRNADHIMEIVERADLDLITIPDTPTYTYANGTGHSTIDLTYSTPDITDEIQKWRTVEEAHSGSDHEPIAFEIQSDQLDTVPEPTTQR